VIPGFHPLHEGVDLKLLALVDGRFAARLLSRFRDWVTFTHTALRICQEHDRALDEPIARAVFALHDGGRGAPLTTSMSSSTKPTAGACGDRIGALHRIGEHYPHEICVNVQRLRSERARLLALNTAW